MLNRVILIGRLTRDPELKRTANTGVALTSFTLAVDRNYQSSKGEKETDFIRIVTWRKLAESCKEYLGKGHLAAVDGKLRARSWETQQGERRTMYEVQADDVRFLERASSSRSRSRDDDGDISDEDKYRNDDSRSSKWSGGTGSTGDLEGTLDSEVSGGQQGRQDKGSLDADPGFPGGGDVLPGGGDELPAEKAVSGKKDFGNVSDSQLDEEIDLDDDDPFKEDF